MHLIKKKANSINEIKPSKSPPPPDLPCITLIHDYGNIKLLIAHIYKYDFILWEEK